MSHEPGDSPDLHADGQRTAVTMHGEATQAEPRAGWREVDFDDVVEAVGGSWAGNAPPCS